MQKQFSGGVLLKRDVLRVCCGLSGAHPFGCVVSKKLQSSFVEITFLRGYSPVCFLCVFSASFLGNTSGGLVLNKDNFIYGFRIYSFFINYSFEDFKVLVLL